MDPNNKTDKIPREESGIDMDDWITELLLELRQRIISERMKMGKRSCPFNLDGLQERKKIVLHCVDQIYTAATSKVDHLSNDYGTFSQEEEKNQEEIAAIKDKIQTIETTIVEMKHNMQQLYEASLGKNPAKPITYPLTEAWKTGPSSSSVLPYEYATLLGSSSQGTRPVLLSQQHQPDFVPDIKAKALLQQYMQQNMQLQQNMQHNATNLLPTQCQQSQWHQANQMLQSQPIHHLPYYNMVQQDAFRPQASGQALGYFLQNQNAIDHQRQLFGSEGALLESSSASPYFEAEEEYANAFDWQGAIHQKIRALRMSYLHDVNDFHQKVVGILQRAISRLPPMDSKRTEMLSKVKNQLEGLLSFLNVEKEDVSPDYAGKLEKYERVILHYVALYRQAVLSVDLKEQPRSHLQNVQQQQQAQIRQEESRINLIASSSSGSGSVSGRGTPLQTAAMVLESPHPNIKNSSRRANFNIIRSQYDAPPCGPSSRMQRSSERRTLAAGNTNIAAQMTASASLTPAAIDAEAVEAANVIATAIQSVKPANELRIACKDAKPPNTKATAEE